jgi:FMN phosphatase YigB (HAD superfamily)
VNGAQAAGLKGVFIARGKRYRAAMAAPDLTAQTLAEAAEALARLPAE